MSIGSTITEFAEQSKQQELQGDIVTTTWKNTLGLPLKVQRGQQTTSYEYDAAGNCVAMTDGEGRITRQGFDPWGRLSNKTLPDGTFFTYGYDPDSNLTTFKFFKLIILFKRTFVSTLDSITDKQIYFNVANQLQLD